MEGGNSVKGERGGEYWKTDGAVVAAVSVSHAAEAFHSFSLLSQRFPLQTIWLLPQNWDCHYNTLLWGEEQVEWHRMLALSEFTQHSLNHLAERINILLTQSSFVSSGKDTYLSHHRYPSRATAFICGQMRKWNFKFTCSSSYPLAPWNCQRLPNIDWNFRHNGRDPPERAPAGASTSLIGRSIGQSCFGQILKNR